METRNSVPNITDTEAITAFSKGLRHEQLHGKLYRNRPTTISELIQTANGYTDAKEAERATRSTHRKTDAATIMIAAVMVMTIVMTEIAIQRAREAEKAAIADLIPPSTQSTLMSLTYDMDFGKLLDDSCPLHKDAKHTMRECRGLKTTLGENHQRSSGTMMMRPRMIKVESEARTRALHTRIPPRPLLQFLEGAIPEDKREQKLIAQCVMSVATYDGPVSNPKYLD